MAEDEISKLRGFFTTTGASEVHTKNI
jgi:hypothetical protein